MIQAFFLIGSLLARLTFVSVFMVEGPSMDPTLHSGELFLLDQYVYTVSEPKRGDVVVFSFEDEPDYYYVKRVIGLPGEKLTVDDDKVYLHYEGGGQEKLAEPYLDNPVELAGASQQLVGEKSYWKKSMAERLFVVPMDKYFVLGDNRTHSLDSRYFSENYVPKNRIKGKFLIPLF